MEELINTLKILSPEEFKQMKNFVCMPHYASSSSCQKLYSTLRLNYPDFDLSPRDIRKLYKKVFPTKDFSLQKLQKACDHLQKTTERYLLQLELEKNIHFSKKIETQVFFEHLNLFGLFQKNHIEVHANLDKTPLKNASYWSEKLHLYDTMYANGRHNKYNAEDTTLLDANSATEFFYAYLKLRYAQNPQESTTEADPFLNEIQKAIQSNFFSEDNLLLALNKDLQGDEEGLNEMKKYLNKKEKSFVSNQKTRK